MVTYLIVIFIIIVLGFFMFYGEKEPSGNRKKIFLIISFFILFLVMGLRSEDVGTDTKLYCNIFNKYSKMTFIQILQSGDSALLYGLYNKLVSLFSTSRNAIIIANSLIICILTIYFIKNNSKHVVLSTIYFCTFYHFFNAMNISRQYIAIMFVANSIKFLKEKNLKKFVLINLIATLIHNTAIISFVLLPWMWMKKNSKNCGLYTLILVIGTLAFDKLIVIFSNVFTHYDLYFSNNLINDIGANKKVVITIIYIFIAFLMHVLIKKMKKRNKDIENNEFNEFYLYYIINYVAIFLGIIALKTMLISRIEMYFSIFAIIYIPEVYSRIKNGIAINLIFTLIMFIPMIVQLSSNNAGVLPYMLYFS